MKYVQAKLQHERTSDISMEMLIFTEGAQIFGVVEGATDWIFAWCDNDTSKNTLSGHNQNEVNIYTK